MSGKIERIRADIAKLTALQSSSAGRIKILRTDGSPPRCVVVQLNYPTAPSRSYPSVVQSETRVRVEFLERYPFSEPNVVIETPILHPNVYSSGKVCLGSKWIPTEGLDLLVRRLVKIIVFDKSLLNEGSPANREALDWYRQAVKIHPGAFPTTVVNFDSVEKPKIKWGNVS